MCFVFGGGRLGDPLGSRDLSVIFWLDLEIEGSEWMMLGAYSFAWHGCGEGETRREIILPYREVVCALILDGFRCCTEYNLAFLFFQIFTAQVRQWFSKQMY
jgi:hypothetical protein